MVTIIGMLRSKLITKEAMEKYCKGEEYQKDSVKVESDFGTGQVTSGLVLIW